MRLTRYAQFLLEGEALPAANAIMVPPYETSPEWTGVWAHEYFHFLQFAGTRMGQLLSFEFASLGHFAKAFLNEPPDVLVQSDVWRFPLMLWAALEESEPLCSCLKQHFKIPIYMVETIGLHLGILPTPSSGNVWTVPKLWLWTLPPKNHIYPVVTTGAGQEIGLLTTLGVMETAAALQGVRFEDADMRPKNAKGSGSALLGFGLTDKQRQLLNIAPLQYRIALKHVENTTQIPSSLTVSATALAADLALDTGIDELNQTKCSIAWEEWYPGWRFVKLIKVIEELLVNQYPWPEKGDELSKFITEIRQKSGWRKPSAEPAPPLSVSPDQRFASDRARLFLAETAKKLRAVHESLWSIGSREQLLEASCNWFKPPIVCHYGKPTYSKTRTDLSEEDAMELWRDVQYEHIAWQLLGHGNPYQNTHKIECFPWSKEGSGMACDKHDGYCRWFPPPPERPLPSDCPMLGVIKDICGDYWVRLRPMVSR